MNFLGAILKSRRATYVADVTVMPMDRLEAMLDKLLVKPWNVKLEREKEQNAKLEDRALAIRQRDEAQAEAMRLLTIHRA